MHGPRRRALVLAVIGSLASLSCALAAPAPAAKPALYGDLDHADISGMWNPDRAPFGPPPSYTPAYATRVAAMQRRAEAGEPDPDTVSQCLAIGMPRFQTLPVEIIQTPGQVTLNTSVLHDIRRIYLDGLGHTDFADPSFSGDSVGRWEGDTLVVETNNIRAGTLTQIGWPYSDKITTVERFRRLAPDKLELVTVMTDPEAFTTPYTVTRTYTLMPRGSRFEEYICENRRD